MFHASIHQISMTCDCFQLENNCFWLRELQHVFLNVIQPYLVLVFKYIILNSEEDDYNDTNKDTFKRGLGINRNNEDFRMEKL